MRDKIILLLAGLILFLGSGCVSQLFCQRCSRNYINYPGRYKD